MMQTYEQDGGCQMEMTRGRKIQPLAFMGYQRSEVSSQLESTRSRLRSIKSVIQQEQEAFERLYIQKRIFHEQLVQQLEDLLEKERMITAKLDVNEL